MAALNFPSSPTAGDKYPTPPVTGIPVYTFDGEKWTTQGGAIGTGGAPLDSPILIGDPKAPTPPPGDNDTSIATTAFVTAAIAAVTVPPATALEYVSNSAPTKMMTPAAVWGSAGQVTIVDAATVTPNLALGSDFVWTLGATGRTLANPTGGKPGQKGLIFLINASGKLATWGSAYKFPNAVKPTLVGGVDIVSYVVGSDSTTMYCAASTGMG